jgi:hypothetical protein
MPGELGEATVDGTPGAIPGKRANLGSGRSPEEVAMSTLLFDFLQQSLPLQLRRAQQFRSDDFAQSLVEEFALPLDRPAASEPERSAATERLLHARRTGLVSDAL